MSTPIGRYELVALDCSDHAALAAFYHSIVGGEIDDAVDDDWIELHTSGGTIGFQLVADHRPPTWPTGERPQQAHLDIEVDDLDVAEPAVTALGAVKMDTQPTRQLARVSRPCGSPVLPRSCEQRDSHSIRRLRSAYRS